jgi:hypothetical protein
MLWQINSANGFYNSINLKLGYKMIEIRTPREILNTTNDGTE